MQSHFESHCSSTLNVFTVKHFPMYIHPSKYLKDARGSSQDHQEWGSSDFCFDYCSFLFLSLCKAGGWKLCNLFTQWNIICHGTQTNNSHTTAHMNWETQCYEEKSPRMATNEPQMPATREDCGRGVPAARAGSWWWLVFVSVFCN